MDILRKLTLTINVLGLVLALIAFSDRDFYVLRYRPFEESLPWMFIIISSTLSIFFIGYHSSIKPKGDNFISLWLKRRKLEEQKRISELEK
jgi:hypothetical protein